MPKQPKKFKVSKITGYAIIDVEKQEQITYLIDEKETADKVCEVFNRHG
jgi:hypothetical protein